LQGIATTSIDEKNAISSFKIGSIAFTTIRQSQGQLVHWISDSADGFGESIFWFVDAMDADLLSG
jgi:hypothetical protein